ncbi:DNA helicase Rep [Pelagibaculum spongiae]|uniref:ATP-dependent DNA helicase Rep n=1 Tax=Pelagibaculum spongiae TaxID=2080658 RepID=A0A2V1GVB1_9GAMM|nr:DNA helicase Rep [Pelagibaculum spongiae]PVZ63564.1 DNA helicase Rep [Pelagibaculum spongiae]
MNLNPQQSAAVKAIEGPVLVLAGAGSGKTRVITEKIAWLIQQCDMRARNIAAVTFTNKAAREMKERVSKLLEGKQGHGLIVSTFHNLGMNIIRKEYKALGIKPGFSLFDSDDSIALLKELVGKDGSVELDMDAIKSAQSKISNWKNDMIDPDQAFASSLDESDRFAARLYKFYQRTMKAYNALDFDDLILMPLMLLKRDPEVRERWQNKIRYLLVDEYQDTNASQYELVRILVGLRRNFTVVGDDDQSVYAWRGANPENLNNLKKDFPSLNVIKLEQNYRSAGRILKCANKLISNNPHVFEKRLWSDKGYGDPLKVISCKTEEAEADRVISELVKHKFINKTDFKDYAMLYRSNHQSRILEQFLIKNRIPYKVNGGTSFFARAEIKDLMAYLRLMANPDDDNAFLRIANVPRRELGPATLEKLGDYANQRGTSLLEAAGEMGLSTIMPNSQLMRLRRFTEWLALQSDNAERGDGVQVIKDLPNEIGYETWLYDSAGSEKAAEARWKNVQELIRWVSGMLEDDEEEGPLTLKEAVNRLLLRDIMERNQDEEQTDQVQLMTLHASKGLEFPHVFLVGMEEDLLPHRVSIDENNIEEERRLAYVGITRAQKTLTMTMAQERRRYGETEQTEPSRFLDELPADDLVWENSRTKTDPSQAKQQGNARLASLKAMLNPD